MTVETDALTEAALRFSEAIRAERTSTLDALANERHAAIQIIQALRSENERRAQQATGRFAMGFLIGTALGITAIYVLNQRTSEEVRLGLVTRAEHTGAALSERFKAAVAIGRRAATTHEQELWSKYRQRLTAKPPAKPHEDPLF
jgi:hypothetical protein